jgi:hypothetical protein
MACYGSTNRRKNQKAAVSVQRTVTKKPAYFQSQLTEYSQNAQANTDRTERFEKQTTKFSDNECK